MFQKGDSTQTILSTSRTKISQKTIFPKQISKKEKLAQILDQTNLVQADLVNLKQKVKGVEAFKREVFNNILNMSFECQRYMNELRIQLEERAQQIDMLRKMLQAKQQKAAEAINQKIDEIESLKAQLRQSNTANQYLKNSKKAQQQSFAKVRSTYQQEISDLNLKINDLLVIIHQKSHKIQNFENQTRKTSARAPLNVISEENLPDRANDENKRPDKSNSKEKINKITPRIEQSHSKRYSILKKPLELTSSDMSQFTSKQEVIQSYRQVKRGSDNQIIQKLQKFVNDLTSSRNYSMIGSSDLDKRRREQTIFTPKNQWSQTLRSRQHIRGNSVNLSFRKCV